MTHTPVEPPRPGGRAPSFPGAPWSLIDRLSTGSRFAIATGTVALFAALSYVADTSAGRPTGTWATLYLAVALASLIGGETTGLFATAIGSAAVIAYALAGEAPAGLLRQATEVTVFLITGILISLAGGTLREARRRAMQVESRLHVMADSAPVLMWAAGPDRHHFWVNRTWLAFTGRSLEQEQGATWQEGLHPDDRAACLEAFRHAFASRSPFEMEYRLRHRDGGFRWVVDRGVPVMDDHGEMSGYVGSCTDIHDRREAERDRERLLASERAARAEAERANQAKEEFLGTISHELRAPLNAIVGWTYLLREQIASAEESRQAIDVIERNARAQVQTVDDLLDMSRLMSGRLHLERSPLDLRDAVADAIEGLRPVVAARALRLEHQIPDVPVIVAGDALRLRQVATNLLSNAAKFTPAGGTITLVLEATAEHAALTVRDTGHGIAPEFLPHVFDRFRQADGSRTRHHGGLGVGLAIVKGVVSEHGGTVHAASDGPDRGATFTVTLPVAPPEASERSDGALERSTSRPLADVRVLVVDDDRETCDLLRRLLEQFGAEVRTSTSVRDALSRWQSEQPDILVSDISMPDQDGYALVREIRRMPAEGGGAVPAIALTAFSRPEDQREALRAGFHLHLRKPVEPYDLVTAVATLTRH